MQQKFLDKLEYFDILHKLSSYARTYIGRDMCLNLRPLFDKNLISLALEETSEAKDLLGNNGSLPIEEIPDINEYIPTLNSNNSLSIKGLLDVCFLLRLSRELKEYFSLANKESYSILSSYFDLIYTNLNIEENIGSKILDENTIDDKASPKLYSIRRDQKNLKADIKDKLYYFIHSSTYSKYLQDNVITIRNDRFVIPVKEEYKSQIKGFIHDISASGSTVFIEPLSIFELNNNLNSLLAEENIEILKILANISSLLFPITKELSSNLEIIGKLDFIFSKAKYSNSINGVLPNLSANKCINLISARHPLISADVVVPITINLGDNFSSLIITRA